MKIDIMIKNNRWDNKRLQLEKNNFIKSIKQYIEKGEKKMKDLASVDRIEGEYAVCELLDGNMVNIPLKDFKSKVVEGDIFDLEIISRNGNKSIQVKEKNIEEMNFRRRKILEKLNKIQNKKL